MTEDPCLDWGNEYMIITERQCCNTSKLQPRDLCNTDLISDEIHEANGIPCKIQFWEIHCAQSIKYMFDGDTGTGAGKSTDVEVSMSTGKSHR